MVTLTKEILSRKLGNPYSKSKIVFEKNRPGGLSKNKNFCKDWQFLGMLFGRYILSFMKKSCKLKFSSIKIRYLHNLHINRLLNVTGN